MSVYLFVLKLVEHYTSIIQNLFFVVTHNIIIKIWFVMPYFHCYKQPQILYIMTISEITVYIYICVCVSVCVYSTAVILAKSVIYYKLF